jgi:hypothetical protein
MLEKPQTTTGKLPTAFIFAGKNKSIEEDKSRSSELFEHQAVIIWNQEASGIE